MKQKVERMNKTKKRISLNAIIRVIAIFVIGIGLVLGLIFSSTKFADSYTLGQDFTKSYQAWVGVYNSKVDARTDGQPNGDAAAAADILASRLNPLGSKDIRISQGGANYLQVTAPIGTYNDAREFQNNIRRSGSVLITDSSFKDIQWTSDTERNPLSSYFTNAEATTKTSGSAKSPYVSYGLNGTAFSDLITSLSSSSDSSQSDQGTSLLFFSDIDEILNDVRYFFSVSTLDNEDDRYQEFYDHVFVPLRNVYDAADTSENVKGVLYDLFNGKYIQRNSSSDKVTYAEGSLIADSFEDANSTGKVSNYKDVETLIKDAKFDYISDTSNYVYDGEAQTADFATDGRYSATVNITMQKNTVKAFKVQDIFSNLVPTVMSNVLASDKTDEDVVNYFVENYVLFNGTVKTDATTTDEAYFDDSHFYTKVASQTKSKITASIFNAASEGFTFVPSIVYTVDSPISQIQLLVAIAILVAMIVAIFVFMIFSYRLLAIITIVITVTAIMSALAIMTVFNLPIGIETILGVIILFAISFEIASTLYSLMRHNVFDKKRGIRSSFKIAVRDAIGFGIDMLVIMIISCLSLFWVGTNSLKSFATMLSIGSAILILCAIIIGMIWIRLIVDTTIFDKAKWLFIVNVDGTSRYVLQEFKINALIARKEKAVAKEKDTTKYDSQIKTIQDKIDAGLSKHDEKLLDKNKKQIAKTQARIQLLEAKMTQLKSSEANTKWLKQKEHLVAKLNKKMAKLKGRIAKLNAAKKQKLIDRLNFKVYQLEREEKIIQADTLTKANTRRLKRLNRRVDDLKYSISAEGQLVQLDEGEKEEHAYTPVEKSRIKRNERAMKVGAQILLIVFALFASLAAIIYPVIGASLDKTFGGAVVYTVWGQPLLQSKNIIDDIANSNQLPDWYRDEANTISTALATGNSNDELTTDQISYTASLIASFLKDTLTKSEIYNNSYFGADVPGAIKVITAAGSGYINNVSDTATDLTLNSMWIQLDVDVKDVKASRAVKQIISKFIGQDENAPISGQYGGYTSKRLHPYTNAKILKQAVIIAALIIAVLLIYIIIRFKWTYYVALALSLLFTAAMIVLGIIIFRINIDQSTVVMSIIGLIIALFVGAYVISSIRSIMSKKNEKSLTKFFEKQINVSVEIKNEKKKVRDEIARHRREMKTDFKLRKGEVTKKEKLDAKLEYKIFKEKLHDDLKIFKRAKREEVRRESRRNNYLFEVVSAVFEKLWKKLIILFVFIVVVTVALILGMSSNISNSFVVIMAFIITSFSSLFILIPAWVVIEQFRIHNKLASKRFIHGIVVSQEEQLVEDIND
jgi:SecD/SecF fusion protein